MLSLLDMLSCSVMEMAAEKYGTIKRHTHRIEQFTAGSTGHIWTGRGYR